MTICHPTSDCFAQNLPRAVPRADPPHIRPKRVEESNVVGNSAAVTAHSFWGVPEHILDIVVSLCVVTFPVAENGRVGRRRPCWAEGCLFGDLSMANCAPLKTLPGALLGSCGGCLHGENFAVPGAGQGVLQETRFPPGARRFAPSSLHFRTSWLVLHVALQ